jgi:hypothetical protein
MAFENQAFHISPIRAAVGYQRNPPLFSDIRRFEITLRIFDEQLLQGQSCFKADAEMAVIPLEHGKRFRAGLECGVAPGLNFVSFG